jgi:transposase
MKVTLSDQEHQRWVEAMKSTTETRLRIRCQVVLMAGRGRPHGHMAEDLAVSVWTLQHWLNRYHQQGPGGLEIRWAPGRAAKIPASLAPEMLDWVRQGPADCGLGRATWTYEALAIYLYQVKGLTVSTTTMRTCCQRHGVHPYRPTYHYQRADPAQQETARHDLHALPKSRGGGTRMAQSRCSALLDDPNLADDTAPQRASADRGPPGLP